MAENNKTPEASLADAPKTPKEKLIKFRIPKTKEEKDDVFVSVNDRTWQIQRGVTVELPECVVEVLRNREVMLETIMEFEEANARET